MKSKELELYSDFLIVNSGQATATGLAEVLAQAVSHEKITRFLSEREYTSKDLWRAVKAKFREIERDDGCLICWHFDHRKGRSVKGVNLLNVLYHSGGVSIPIAFEIVKKLVQFCDVATRQVKRASKVTKNEQMRAMIQSCVINHLKFKYILMDSWFSSKENFNFIVQKKKHFIAALKENRLVALSEEERKQGRFFRMSSLELSDQQGVRGWLKGAFKKKSFWFAASLQTKTAARAY